MRSWKLDQVATRKGKARRKVDATRFRDKDAGTVPLIMEMENRNQDEVRCIMAHMHSARGLEGCFNFVQLMNLRKR